MADSDYDAVRPIQSLQTIQSLAPTERRQERRRQQTPQNMRETPPEQRDDSEETNEDSNPIETPDDDNPHLVDYCA